VKVTVEISPMLVRITRSPIYVIISALSGVSISFAPVFLYWSGQGKFFPGYERFAVPLCFVVIYCAPGFYFLLGGRVAKELRQESR
jgi:hypothetical protein